jgi:hypothetical protein
MELLFTITPAHTAIRLRPRCSARSQLQGQQRRAVAHVAHWQSRWLSPLLYWLCRRRPAMAGVVHRHAGVGLLFTLLWRRYASAPAGRRAPAPSHAASRPCRACTSG